MSDRAKNGPKPGASKRASPKRGGPKPPRKPPRRPNARAVATEVLFRVQTDGAWAAPTLRSTMSCPVANAPTQHTCEAFSLGSAPTGPQYARELPR